ncbi:MAG TPA: DNA polymerase [Candidatus Paceibacterota bacterium]|nr:DNA polymerase [Candidatus Paceibacterota bacterium]
MTKKLKKIILLDAHAIIHRAYHALPELTSPAGEPVGALYGLAAMLLKIIKDLDPDFLIACYDLPEKTFRHEAYAGYKATRKEVPADLIVQLQRSRDIFHAFSVPIYDKAGFEADDILGTIAEKLNKQKDLDIIIASGDMDTLQLVGEGVRVYTLKKGLSDTILYDEKAVKERFGFGPKLLPDYKGLRGDPSDNIIGVSGIGEKTATLLISKFGTIEEIYERLKKNEQSFVAAGVKPKTIEKLKAEEEEALFSKTLAQIKTDVPIDFFLPAQSWKEGINLEKIEKLFQTLGFRSLVARLGESFSVQTGKPVAPASVPETEIKKIAIGLWLLNSAITNPGLPDILVYGGSDFETARKRILEEIKKNNLEFVYNKIELPLLPIIKKMEARGVLFDLGCNQRLKEEYQTKLRKIEEKIWALAGVNFNINSPKQLTEILFEKLKLSAKGIRKTTTKARSTSMSELNKLKSTHPIIADIINYRETSKILFTYLLPLPNLVDKENRIHARFIQTGTTTGRFSSVEPNLQNIPIRNEGKEVRRSFIAAPGYKLVAFDYSQIELRIAALLSQDKNFIEIFKSGKDVHNEVAARVFGVPEDKVTPDMRRQAKVINFGILYGMGITALKTNLGTSEVEAKKFHEEYLAAFPGLAAFLDEVKAKAFTTGFTETLFGRRRYFPELKSKIPYIRSEAERMAVNAPIQGTATADIIKLAMKETDKVLADFDAHLILQVHDELIFEVAETKVEKLTPIIKKIMENIIPKEFLGSKEAVPLVVGVKKGNNWGEFE